MLWPRAVPTVRAAVRVRQTRVVRFMGTPWADVRAPPGMRITYLSFEIRNGSPPGLTAGCGHGEGKNSLHPGSSLGGAVRGRPDEPGTTPGSRAVPYSARILLKSPL